MSGGHFNYTQFHIKDIADQIHDEIVVNDSTEKNGFGEDIGNHYPPEIIAKFKEAVATLNRASNMAHRIDWLLSGDDSEETFLKRWDEELTH
jgi:hypothetical protein